MKLLDRCIDVASAQGYTRSDQEPTGKGREIPTASTAAVKPETKDQQTEEIWGGRYAVDIYKLRSIKSSARVIVEYGIDRKKSLQIDISMGMRAMRAVFCWVLR
jgi:hypothetical protein